MLSRDEQERRRREAIAEVGRRFRESHNKGDGPKISQEGAERRVRTAILKNEAQQG